MKFLSSLDRKDRRMVLATLILVAALIVVVAIFAPARDPNKSDVPDSYLTGQHGAKAAYTLLEQSGYAVQRWEQPLSELAPDAGPGTVLILAEPVSLEVANGQAVHEILAKGGRVLATGAWGGYLLPNNSIAPPKAVDFAVCEAQPDGLSPLSNPSSGAGTIFIAPNSAWDDNRPEYRSAYTCAGQPVVVEYDSGKGHVVWWASSTPLENGSITRGQNLELLLNSIGPVSVAGKPQHIFWDESLHGNVRITAKPNPTPVWSLLWWGLFGMGLLLVFSFSRRSGPVRPLPQMARTTPIEFLDALGGLYRSTGANSTAVQIAWERFRQQAAHFTGQRLTGKGAQMDAEQLSVAIARRFGSTGEAMKADLIAAEAACSDYDLKPRRALAIVQSLRRHEETLRAASSTRGITAPSRPRLAT